ncbi:hypothetical protein [Bifidobacterium mongoliense]|uniref:hypothetical protein n=1 Tax=Bifidobacterium mongoliense TaxID=518643 RepID=UPI0026491C99|nr:hypothetical protein [Bifidobacterium mongoliense]MDN5980025.1 hypothetical protein [Bifidobacterium mongoliense]MDN6769481.1 hypothetical protein [Bifidobacterium mongoliense]MDN6783567.1 hypothetical protein [Bifidobacterium mongoliense]
MDTITDKISDDDAHDLRTSTPDEARRILDESGVARGLLPYREIRSYGWTVMWVSLVQVLLFFALGVLWSVAWSWDSIVLIAVSAILLSYFAVRGEQRHRHMLPHSSRNIEHIAQRWRTVLSVVGCVLVGVAAANAGMPAPFGSRNGTGLGWFALVAGIILALGAAGRLVFAIKLLRNR